MKFIKLSLYTIIYLFVFAMFLSAFASNSSAQSATPFPSPEPGASPSYWINGYPVGDDPTLWGNHDLDFKYKGDDPDCKVNCTQGLRIDQTVPDIKLQFTGLNKDKDYYLCGQSDTEKCILGGSATGDKFHPDDQGNITLTVCGGGVNWTKGAGIDGTSGTLEEKCDGKDYFHEGETYKVGVYQDAAQANNIITAEFFTKHSYPVVKMTPINNTLEVSLWGRRPGGNNDNNYQVVVEGVDNDYKKVICYTTKDGSGPTVGIHTQGIDLSTGKVIPDQLLKGEGFGNVKNPGSQTAETHVFDRSGSGLGTGTYVLKINERKSDNRPLGIAEKCEGGHSYLYIYFRINGKNPKDFQIFKVNYDPNNSDWDDVQDLLKQGKSPFPPCAEGELDEASGTRSALDTAIGKIPTTLQGFITKMFQFVLILAGLGGVIIIVYAGFVFMTSRGDKEKIAGARETLTAAIVGLLFIILSIVILEIIGVDLLKIPGFSR